ncbi:MAG: hypothetical protein KC416_10525 [Myxococcales bacterium]|nr:hypothetical protein [Myxococcales bacterium]
MFVIDLRGNGGGDDSRAHQLAEVLRDAPATSGMARTHRRNSPEAYTLFLNTLDQIARKGDVLAPHLSTIYGRFSRWRDEARASHGTPPYLVEEDPQGVPPPGPNAYGGTIAILVDEGCASICESGLDVLRHHPRATVYGRRTGGYKTLRQ